MYSAWPCKWSSSATCILLACLALLCCHVPSTEGCQGYMGSWEQDLPRCDMTQQDYMNGSWRKLGEECAPGSIEELGEHAYPYETLYNCNPRLHTCTNETDTCRHKAVGMASWQWVSGSCNLHHFSAEQLDRKLAGRKVMMVGDSIQIQQFYSLRHMMRQVVAGPHPPEWGNFYTHSGAQFHMQPAQFLVGESCCDHIEGQSLEVLHHDGGWLQWTRNVDVLVVNTGHHWHRRDVTFESYETMVRNVLQTLKHHFNGTVIFRTTSWGHHRCSSIREPLHDATEALHYATLDDDPYHWMGSIFREHLWGDIAKEIGMIDRFRFINASMTMLRGDGHMDGQTVTATGEIVDDCLHFCLPGVPDYWNWLLANALVGLDLSPQP